jgi:hypothetical protein
VTCHSPEVGEQMPAPLPTRASEEQEKEAMGSLTIGAKYRTTLRDPGTSGVLNMVRVPSSLAVSAPLPSEPCYCF